MKFKLRNHVVVSSFYEYVANFGLMEGYNRAALCISTGQICSAAAELFASSSPLSEQSLPSAGLKPFCTLVSPCSLAKSASMKVMLSGSRLTFSASASGILQDRSRARQRYAHPDLEGANSTHSFYLIKVLRQAHVTASGMSGKNWRQS